MQIPPILKFRREYAGSEKGFPRLTEEGVTKAAVETVAENASDGVIAPMLYMAIGGVWLMFLYKGINTMDSMLGYKNDKYLYFGRCIFHIHFYKCRGCHHQPS